MPVLRWLVCSAYSVPPGKKVRSGALRARMTKVILLLPLTMCEIQSSATFRAKQSFHHRKSASKLRFSGTRRIRVWEASDAETTVNGNCVGDVSRRGSCTRAGHGADRATTPAPSRDPSIAGPTLRLGRRLPALEWTKICLGSGLLCDPSTPPCRVGSWTLGSASSRVRLGSGILAVAKTSESVELDSVENDAAIASID